MKDWQGHRSIPAPLDVISPFLCHKICALSQPRLLNHGQSFFLHFFSHLSEVTLMCNYWPSSAFCSEEQNQKVYLIVFWKSHWLTANGHLTISVPKIQRHYNKSSKYQARVPISKKNDNKNRRRNSHLPMQGSSSHQSERAETDYFCDNVVVPFTGQTVVLKDCLIRYS